MPAPVDSAWGLSTNSDSISLTDLRSRVRERADMVGSSFVTDAANSLDAWINEGLHRLHGRLVDAYGEEYCANSANYTFVTGTTSYDLPDYFLKLYAIDMTLNGYVRSLKKMARSERNIFRNRSAGIAVPRYMIRGQKVVIYPEVPNGTAFTVHYAPRAKLLSGANLTTNIPAGWEQYIVLYAAIQALHKEETDARHLQGELAKLEHELDLTKEQRDLAGPHQAVDTDLVEVEDELLW